MQGYDVAEILFDLLAAVDESDSIAQQGGEPDANAIAHDIA
jgi:hypothetical protein